MDGEYLSNTGDIPKESHSSEVQSIVDGEPCNMHKGDTSNMHEEDTGNMPEEDSAYMPEEDAAYMPEEDAGDKAEVDANSLLKEGAGNIPKLDASNMPEEDANHMLDESHPQEVKAYESNDGGNMLDEDENMHGDLIAQVPQGPVSESGSGGVVVKKWPGWPGENVFRMLVPARKVGGIIGHKGELIKKITEETKARIKILDGPPGSMERVVLRISKATNH